MCSYPHITLTQPTSKDGELIEEGPVCNTKRGLVSGVEGERGAGGDGDDMGLAVDVAALITWKKVLCVI